MFGTSSATTTSDIGPRNDERRTANGSAFLNGSLKSTRLMAAGANTSFIRDPEGTLISMCTSTGACFYDTIDARGSIALINMGSTQTRVATDAHPLGSYSVEVAAREVDGIGVHECFLGSAVLGMIVGGCNRFHGVLRSPEQSAAPTEVPNFAAEKDNLIGRRPCVRFAELDGTTVGRPSILRSKILPADGSLPAAVP